MTPATTMPVADRPRSRLRLIPSDRRAPERPATAHPAPTSQAPTRPALANVLVAGADDARRSKMLGDLRGLLPEGTRFVEAGETWQVLSYAAESRMAIVTGDLGDISAQGLMRVLSRRYPLLPVIALSGDRRLAQASDIGVASL